MTESTGGTKKDGQMCPSYEWISFANSRQTHVFRSLYTIPTSACDSYSMSYFFIFLYSVVRLIPSSRAVS